MDRSCVIIFSCVLLAAAAAGLAQESDTLASSAPTDSTARVVAPDSATNADSAGALNAEAVSPTTVSRAKTDGDSGDIIIVRETKDTVYVANKSDFQTVMKSTRRKARSLRTRGFGIGGGPTPGLYAIDMSPIKKLTNQDFRLQGKSYDFGILDYKAFHMRGGMGYAGLGNGLRIGGGGAGGQSDIISHRFSGDSSLVLQTHVGFGGFLLEKAFIMERFNFNVGGYLGGGNIEVKAKAIDFSSVTWFDFDLDADEGEALTADFMLIELHGGFTFTIVPIFHLGLDISLPGFLSPNGFSSPAIPVSSEFFTINPGLQARVIFGNLG